MRFATFIAPTSEEWLVLEGLETLAHSYASEFRRLASAAWKALPNGLKEASKPLHNLGVSWQPWRPEPAWQWLYFVFRQLRGQGDLVRRERLGDIELIYLSVGVFRASALAASNIESANDTPGIKPQWDRKRRELRLGEGSPVRFLRHAPAMFGVLDALQKKGWPTTGIPNPLTDCSKSPQAAWF